MRWNWIPGSSCGEFQLGGRFELSGYSEPLTLLEPSCEGADWETYQVGDGQEARVSVNDGLVVSVECFRSMLYDGKELIGVREGELESLLGHRPELKESWPDGSAQLEVSPLGLTLWIEHGVVDGATVWPV